jgi:hypothetical protein
MLLGSALGTVHKTNNKLISLNLNSNQISDDGATSLAGVSYYKGLGAWRLDEPDQSVQDHPSLPWIIARVHTQFGNQFARPPFLTLDHS